MNQNCSFHTLSIKGMDCPDCASKIENSLRHAPGISKANINFHTANLHLELDHKQTSLEEVEKRIKRLGYTVSKNPTTEKFKIRNFLLTAVSGALILLSFLLSWQGFSFPATWSLYVAAMVLTGYPMVKKGFISIINFNLDLNFLMTIAVAGSIVIGDLPEAASIVFLFSLAQLLEEKSMDRARNAIRSIMKLAPKEAKVRRNSEETIIKVEDVGLSEIFIIHPGDKIPVDGIVTAGSSWVNQAPITGESKPVEKKLNDKVFAGTINLAGALEVSVTHLVNDTTLSRIIHMVEEAQAHRAPSHDFVNRFAKIYTPIMLLLAVGVTILPPLLFAQPLLPWFYRSLVLLVISCPCALVISTPVAIVSGLTVAARKGILIKGGIHLENIGVVKAIAFDKTGTVTKGEPSLVDIITLNGCSKEKVLKIAATIESRSEHPIAFAVLARAEQEGITPGEGREFQAMPGLGAKMRINDETFYLGNHRLLHVLNICNSSLDVTLEELEENAQTALVLSNEKEPIAIMTIADEIRENIPPTISKLRKLGIEKMVIITGDNLPTARAIAKKIGISEYRAELLPHEKLSIIEDLVKKYGKVAMVGDGINDAPSLARATIGLTVGQSGSDTALETADITLMGDDLSLMPVAMKIGQRTLFTIKTNIVISLLIKAIFFGLAIAGLATLWMAIIADMGASLLVIFNGLRLLNTKT